MGEAPLCVNGDGSSTEVAFLDRQWGVCDVHAGWRRSIYKVKGVALSLFRVYKPYTPKNARDEATLEASEHLTLYATMS